MWKKRSFNKFYSLLLRIKKITSSIPFLSSVTNLIFISYEIITLVKIEARSKNTFFERHFIDRYIEFGIKKKNSTFNIKSKIRYLIDSSYYLLLLNLYAYLFKDKLIVFIIKSDAEQNYKRKIDDYDSYRESMNRYNLYLESAKWWLKKGGKCHIVDNKNQKNKFNICKNSINEILMLVSDY